MSSGTLNDNNTRGTAVDGHRLVRPAENQGSVMPTGPAAGATHSQTGVGQTSSGLQVGSQLPQVSVKQTGRRTLEGSYDGMTDKVSFSSKSPNFSAEQFKNAPGPRNGTGA